MRRIEPEHQPIEQPPPPGRPFDKQPIHQRGQPQHPEPLGERGLAARRLAIDADRAALAARVVASGADANRTASGLDGRRDRPARDRRLGRRDIAPGGADIAPVDIAKPGVAQAAAGGQKRHRFQEVGLAGAVRPGQHHGLGAEPGTKPNRTVIAEIC